MAISDILFSSARSWITLEVLSRHKITTYDFALSELLQVHIILYSSFVAVFAKVLLICFFVGTINMTLSASILKKAHGQP